MPKTNKKPLLLMGAAALLIAGGATAYWLLLARNGWLGIGNNTPAAAQLIPQDVLVAMSISTDSQQWQQLREYGTPESQAAFGKQLQQLENALISANGYSYQQDIQPWVGKEVMIAYLSPTASQTPSPTVSSSRQSVVMALPIENPAQAKQVLAKPKPQKTGKVIERNYKGIQIQETQGAATQSFSSTVLGRFLIVSTDPKATERVIDTYQGATSLLSTPGYSAALGKLNPGQPFARLYFNIPAASAMAATNSARSLSPEQLLQLQEKQGVAATVTLEPQGIRFQGVSWLKPNSQRVHTVENNAKSMPRRLPADTLMMMSGGNLQQLWQDYVQGAQSNPIIPMSPDNLKKGLKQGTGLDLEQDLLPWMAGEFSLALIPAPQGVPSNLGTGVVFMVQASDRVRGEKALKQLDEFIVKEYGFQAQETQLNGQSVINWTSPLGGLSGTHGWLEGNVAFLALGAPVANTLVSQPQTTLLENELFNQAVPTQPEPKNGHFFIDMERTVNAGNLALPQISPNQKIFTNGIRAIGVTAGINNERSTRFDIFVLMKKAGSQSDSQPSPTTPLPSSPSPQASPTPTTSP